MFRLFSRTGLIALLALLCLVLGSIPANAGSRQSKKLTKTYYFKGSWYRAERATVKSPWKNRTKLARRPSAKRSGKKYRKASHRGCHCAKVCAAKVQPWKLPELTNTLDTAPAPTRKGAITRKAAPARPDRQKTLRNNRPPDANTEDAGYTLGQENDAGFELTATGDSTDQGYDLDAAQGGDPNLDAYVMGEGDSASLRDVNANSASRTDNLVLQ